VDAEARADQTIGEHPEQVAAWLAGRPGAWGFLAGQAVLGERARLGRRLSEPERRAVWAALWAELERLRDG
jgi:hypothetical protein